MTPRLPQILKPGDKFKTNLRASVCPNSIFRRYPGSMFHAAQTSVKHTWSQALSAHGLIAPGLRNRSTNKEDKAIDCKQSGRLGENTAMNIPPTGRLLTRRQLLGLPADESGAAAIEYGLIVAGTALGIAVGMRRTKRRLKRTLRRVKRKLK